LMNHPAGAASVAQTLSPPMRDFIARSRSRLTLEVPAHLNAPATIEELAALQGDHRMALDMAGVLADKPFRPAAVLVPVVAKDEPVFLLTQRAEGLSTHSGQIAFPGG